MRIRVILAAAAALALAACSESSTSPRVTPTAPTRNEVLICRSGYHVATRDDGSEYCASDSGSLGATASTPDSTAASP